MSEKITKKQRPKLSKAQIWNMSLGFLGIQMGFALQTTNGSNILKIFGADVHELSWFWIVAPLTGLIIQPIIGHYSDKTWTKLGRRRPYFLLGAALASIGLVLLPQAHVFVAYIPALWVGAGFLTIMDASFNVAMEPFRALVADKLNSEQRTAGFSIQTILIGIGAVVGSALPYMLSNWFGVSNDTAPGIVADNILWSFIIGALVLMTTILITIFTTEEYSPEEMAEFDGGEAVVEVDVKKKGFFAAMVEDYGNMPKTMKQLGSVQFFSWFGLFGMWVFLYDGLAQHVFDLPIDKESIKNFTQAQSETAAIWSDWIGVIYGVMNGVAAVFAFFIAKIAVKIGRKKTHAIALFIGAMGFFSFYIMPDENWLLVSMGCIGVAWASILAMPYAMLAGSIPAHKMGVYMGIFNLFIVLPQILNALIGGPIVEYLYGGQPIYALIMSGVAFVIAALLVRRVEDKDDRTEIIAGGSGH